MNTLSLSEFSGVEEVMGVSEEEGMRREISEWIPGRSFFEGVIVSGEEDGKTVSSCSFTWGNIGGVDVDEDGFR